MLRRCFCPSARLPVCPSARLRVCPSARLPVCLSFYLSMILSVTTIFPACLPRSRHDLATISPCRARCLRISQIPTKGTAASATTLTTTSFAASATSPIPLAGGIHGAAPRPRELSAASWSAAHARQGQRTPSHAHTPTAPSDRLRLRRSPRDISRGHASPCVLTGGPRRRAIVDGADFAFVSALCGVDV